MLTRWVQVIIVGSRTLLRQIILAQFLSQCFDLRFAVIIESRENLHGILGESNILDGVMKEDFLVNFDGKDFTCLDKGFKKNEPVDIVIRPEDVDIVVPVQGMIEGEVTSVTFLGVHYEIIVDINGFKWMIQTTDEHKVGDMVGLYIEPDAIHIMHKSTYSGTFGDYSSYSDEFDEMSDPDEETL